MPARQIDPNRHQMLAKVRRDWIDGYLKHSLDNLARIELGLEEKSDAVSRPWDVLVQQPGRAPRPLPSDQPMSAIFDELGQALLILGAPGAGKTTLLLELARDLLDRAAQDAAHPIAVVFHLSSWAVRRRPLTGWLVDELTERYYVPRKLAQTWTDAEQVLPLLDGLDEVAPEHRAACVEAINDFRREHGLVPLAVCCRKEDYEELPVRVALSGAVVIEPLSRAQVSTYLTQAGKPLAGVRMVLRDDETLYELLQTPLMLSIVALAYQGRSAAEVRATGSLEQRRAHLFENYIRKMFERRTEVTGYTREQTLRWLTWLAQSLMCNNLSVFYVEWIQPDWLPSRTQRWLVALAPITFSGLVGGLFFGRFDGLVVGLVNGLNRISPAETLGWSWRKARRFSVRGLLFGGLVVGLLVGLPFGLLFGLYEGLFDGLVFGLVLGLVGGLFGALVVGLVGGLTTGRIVTRTIPNVGIRRSRRNALLSVLFVGLVLGLVVGLFGGLFGGLMDGLFGGLFFGLVFGMIAWLSSGGDAYIKHYALRFLLWRNDYAPWSYIPFLDNAAERVFLRKVTGGYVFTHRHLMDYFATLQPTDLASG